MKVSRNVCFYVFITCMLLFVQEARSTDTEEGEEDQEGKRKDEASQSDSDNKSEKQADSSSNIKRPENWEEANKTMKKAAEKEEELSVVCIVNYDLNPKTDSLIKELATTYSDKTFIVMDENKMFVENEDTNGKKVTEKIFNLKEVGSPVFVVHKFSYSSEWIFKKDKKDMEEIINRLDNIKKFTFYLKYSMEHKTRQELKAAKAAAKIAKAKGEGKEGEEEEEEEEEEEDGDTEENEKEEEKSRNAAAKAGAVGETHAATDEVLD